MQVKIEEQLLSHKTIFLNLSLKERAMGLDDIVKDLNSFFSLSIFFWNLSKNAATEINLKENQSVSTTKALNQNSPETVLLKKVEKRKCLNSALVERLCDRPIKTNQTKYYESQDFNSIITTLIAIYESPSEGIFIIENISQLISSKTLNVFQFELVRTWLLKLTQKSRQEQNFYLIILGSATETQWQFEDIAPTVTLPYLSSQEISNILKEKFAKLRLKDSDKDSLLQKGGKILAGMTRPELLWGVNNITNSLSDDQSAQAYLDKLLKYKQNKLKQLGLSFLPPPEISEIGGMDLLKSKIEQLEVEFTADREKYNLPETDGWVFVGVPGVGKSLTAKIIQVKLALPMIHIPAEKVKDNGPAYLSQILELCEATAPNIVYFDELEKIFPGGDLQGEAATTMAVFLTWLQEKTASCFVLATLNRLDTLPPELIRAGRFSEVWYVGFPQPKERREIFKLYLKKYDQRYQEDLFSPEQWRELINESIRFTGAEIAQVIEKTYRDKFFERVQIINKLKEKTFQYSEKLIELIKLGYEQKFIQARDNSVNFNCLEGTISKVMMELPTVAEEIDRLYGELINNNQDGIQQSLEKLIDQGYKEIINHHKQKIITIDSLDGQVSQALIDLAEKPQLIQKIEYYYEQLMKIRETHNKLDKQSLQLDYQTVLKFTIEETPLFERAVEKVMAIENRARKICRPVTSKDESNLIDREPTFWPEMKEAEAIGIINQIRGKEAEANGINHEKQKSIEEAVLAGTPEYNAAYWAF